MTITKKTNNTETVFGANGILANAVPGYEPRDQQMRISEIIERAISEENHAFAEGTTGTGKTFSYLIPAIHHVTSFTDKVVVVATANIALQEQLIEKDLPRLAKILPQQFTYGLLKGLNNYACKIKLTKTSGHKDLFIDKESLRQYAHILDWAEDSDTGDVSELPFVPSPQVWARSSCMTDDCVGVTCPEYGGCFGQVAKRKALGSHIIVTNYHMLFAHFAVKESGGPGILPEFDVLIMDEAHEAAEIARDFFGFKVSDRSVTSLAGMVKNSLKDEALSNSIVKASGLFFADIAGYAQNKNYKIRLKHPNFVDPSDLISKLKVARGQALKRLEDLVDSGESKDNAQEKKSYEMISMRANKLVNNLKEAVEQSDTNMVYWIDSEPGSTKICAKMIVSGPRLGPHLFDSETIRSTICVSATMTTGHHADPHAFDFIRTELGAPDNILKYAGTSPFNFKQQALVVVPPMPDPKSAQYPDAVADATNAVIRSVGGKTLALFTSYKNLNATYNKVRNCGYRVMKQGELPRNELMRIFRDDVTSVLLGTDSFWTGVDIQGEALSGLVIDRLPFANPMDPVIDAICERDKNAFMKYLVPHAVIKFKQGVGRLIRTRTDVGVVVILDNRIVNTNWGKGCFWSALPEGINALKSLDQVGSFITWASSNVWLEDVYSLVKQGKSDDAVDVIHNNLSRMVSTKSFPGINGVLSQVTLPRLNEACIRSFVSALKPFETSISGYAPFTQKVREHVSKVAPERLTSMGLA